MITINGVIYRSPFNYWRVLFWIEIGKDFYTTESISMSMKRHKRLMFKRAIYHVSFTRHFAQIEFELEVRKAKKYKEIQFEMKRETLADLVKSTIPVSYSPYYEVRKELVKKLKKKRNN